MDRGGEHLTADPRLSRRLLGSAPSVLFYLAAALAAFLLWPTSLGGCTTITLVSGHSMEPLYRTGDIVVARCGAPQVGDIVVYEPQGLDGARIIHRIIGGDGATGWVMKGDNNSAEDPFSPTDADVLGSARLHIPKVGILASTLTSPWIWVSLIVIALAVLVWPGREDDDDEDDDDVDAAPDEAPLIPDPTGGEQR